MFYWRDGIVFKREEDGSVSLIKISSGQWPLEDKSNVVWEHTLDDGSWASAVLTVSAFGELPNNWYKFMDFHTGRENILSDEDYLAAFKEGYRLGGFEVPLQEEELVHEFYVWLVERRKKLK